MAQRDGSDPDPMAPANRRYREGQELYVKESRPRQSADVVVDYSDVDNPILVRG